MVESLQLFLIEDDDDVALLIRKSLERAQHRVVHCRTAADALIVLEQHPFDLIILDQMLPDMSGLELLRHVERSGNEFPVLMVTAHGDESLASEVLRTGVLDYLVKDEALTFLVELPKRVHESVNRSRLEKQNRLLVQSLESASDGIMIIDRSENILTVNGSLLRLTGYERHEVPSLSPRVILGEAPWAEVRKSFQRGRVWQGELSIRRKDGLLVQTSLSFSPIPGNQNHITHYVGIVRDVTETKKLERQLLQAQKLQSIGTLAGGIAHEFNNLLAGINGYASLALREPNGNEATGEFLNNIVALSERAALLTRQLLAFARKPALIRQPTEITELVRATVELIRRTLHQNVLLEVSLGGEDPSLIVDTDGNQLQQALVNLAVNARDAIRDREKDHPPVPGEPDRTFVTVRLAGVRLIGEILGVPQNVPPGEYALLQVLDQGCGMTPSVLSQAVDPFFTTKDVGKGTGLGLAVVFGIVQGHQGYLQIDSSPNLGTTISIYLPRIKEPMPVPTLIADPASQEPVATFKKPIDILVIDDEHAVLDVVRRYLEISGHHVCAVPSGKEALLLLHRNRNFGLVILDLMIPAEDAGTTFTEIQRLIPQVPVLVCSGLPESDPAPRLLQLGAVAILRKPFRLRELLEAVQTAAS